MQIWYLKESGKSPLQKTLRARFEVDHRLNIIGGEWMGNLGEDHQTINPDFIWFPGPPLTTKDGFLKENPHVHWPLVKSMVQKSANGLKKLENSEKWDWSRTFTKAQEKRDQRIQRIAQLLNITSQELPIFYFQTGPDLSVKMIGSFAEERSLSLKEVEGRSSWPLRRIGHYVLLDESWYWSASKEFQLIDENHQSLTHKASSRFVVESTSSSQTFSHLQVLFKKRWRMAEGTERIDMVLQLRDLRESQNDPNSPRSVQVMVEILDGQSGKVVPLTENNSFQLYNKSGGSPTFSFKEKVPSKAIRLFFILKNEQDESLPISYIEKQKKRVTYSSLAHNLGFDWKSEYWRKQYPLQVDISR